MLASRRLMARFIYYRTSFVHLYSLPEVCNHNENRKCMLPCVHYNQVRGKKDGSFQVFFQQQAETSKKNSNFGNATPTVQPKKLSPRDITAILTNFIRKAEVRTLAAEKGLTAKQLRMAYVRFRGLCLSGKNIPVELEIVLNDIMMGAAHPDDLFRQFIDFSMKLFPHLQCRDELAQICDLRDPASWYPQARALGRKIIFHAGPTNSGKTHHALEKFMEAKVSVYCGPLKMLASEIFLKTRDKGFDCDLATGDERIYSSPDGEPSDRLSCTVEMAPLSETFDVAVIDEIQMLQDQQRGWAWSRALLGIAAKEVHVCGEAAAIPLVQNLLATAGETVEVCEYKRLSGLKVENKALSSFDNAQPGDCFVCFNKRDLYKATKSLENLGHRVAVIYGSLPPGAKLSQCKKFNDDNDPCNIMVATDAIGMGLNLNIRRIIFVSLRKVELSSDGKRTFEPISVSQALQIAGRAGRFGTQYGDGYVTTLHSKDLRVLESMLSSSPLPVEKAGLYPTAEQVEMIAYYLPDCSLQSILEIFHEMNQMDDSLYFMCNIESFKYLAEKVDSLQLPLRARYIFCCSPVNIKDVGVVSMLLKMARCYGNNKVMNRAWLDREVKWPPPVPSTLADMSKLESLHDVFDLFLWLSLRFPDLFQEAPEIRVMKATLDDIIAQGLARLPQLMDKFSEGQIETSELWKDDKPASHGTLEEDLVRTGKLSPEIIDRLKYEWKKELHKNKDEVDE